MKFIYNCPTTKNQKPKRLHNYTSGTIMNDKVLLVN
jgi:hypothetical protein